MSDLAITSHCPGLSSIAISATNTNRYARCSVWCVVMSDDDDNERRRKANRNAAARARQRQKDKMQALNKVNIISFSRLPDGYALN